MATPLRNIAPYSKMSEITEITNEEASVLVLTPGNDTFDLMKSRIQQQSELISLMKKRSDGMILKLTSQEKAIKALEEAKVKLEDSLNTKQRNHETLQSRFDVLSQNHDEMIKLKNEYKDELTQLRLKHQTLLDSGNDSLFTTQALETEIDILHKDLSVFQAQNKVLCDKCDRMEQDATTHRSNIKSVHDEILLLKKQLEDNKLKLKECRQAAHESQNNAVMQKQQNANLEATNVSLKELLLHVNSQLSTTTNENALIKEKMMKLETELNTLRTESKAMSRDAKFQLLQSELEQIRTELKKTQEEYSAYQEFATKRLKEEKCLNEKLRHLAV